MREMRKRSFSDTIDRYFKLGNNLNQCDVIAVRKTTSGLKRGPRYGSGALVAPLNESETKKKYMG